MNIEKNVTLLFSFISSVYLFNFISLNCCIYFSLILFSARLNKMVSKK